MGLLSQPSLRQGPYFPFINFYKFGPSEATMPSLGEAWAPEPDLETRDPNNLNDHLKVTFEEALGEPDHTHALDCVWKYSYKCFNFYKALCYLIATTLCGIPMAICWGCYFACVA